MNRIIALPDSVKRMIAAGEVVEGPFSVIKELMENSIDAGSTNIDVEIFDSGFKRMVVRDNGVGIYREDLPLTIVDHATSRISDISDINKITSFGFRGEALSSISSISKLSIHSRSREEDVGAKFVSFNNTTDISDYVGRIGTSVIVENLFYNTPARKKFLKSKNYELRKIREVFFKLAFPIPEIAFSLNVDGKREITLPAVGSIDDRIHQIYGKTIMGDLYFERLQDLKIEISAYLSKPHFMRSSRSLQLLYVNRRSVEYRFLGFLLSKAYEGLTQKGKHPAAFILLSIDPQLVDINIHPAKREVKFFDQGYINNLILGISKRVLGNQAHKISSNFLKHGEEKDKDNDISVENPINTIKPGSVNDIFLSDHVEHADKSIKSSRGGWHEGVPNPTNRLRYLIDDVAGLSKEIEKHSQGDDIKLLGIIFDTYIMAEEDEAVYIIDFHAAHERFIYDSIIQEDSDFEIQTLIFPSVIELSIEDYQIVIEKKDFFKKIAFDIDSFSDNAIIIRGIPENLDLDLDVEDFFIEVVESLKTNGEYSKDIKTIIAEKIACHSAKRSGDTISPDDARMIVCKALKGDYELRCPHGRPYIHRLEKRDLEKIFHRI
ncbi:MAG: DNA mismatch repair endonuclease MutL [Spirochaetota bacterium]|nr:DNA mismatch repair endonuclease MutL [Spirochaetota bacterium]